MFVDTNIFLHFQFFRDVDWCAELRARRIHTRPKSRRTRRAHEGFGVNYGRWLAYDSDRGEGMESSPTTPRGNSVAAVLAVG